MDALIQIPVIDLRGFLAHPTGRLARPGWPVGLVAEPAGNSQFMRGFSSLRTTLGSETGNWQGRAQHVDASRALRFPSEFDRAVRRIVATSIPTGSRRSELNATCLGRAFYGSQTSPRNFMQIRIALNDPDSYSRDHWDAIVDALLSLRVKVAGDKEVPLAHAGAPLATCVRIATTKRRFNGKVPTWAVTSGRLLLVLEVARRDGDTMPSPQADLDLRSGNGKLWHLEKPGADIWVVERPRRKRRRHASSAAALHLSRLHSERVTLTKLAAALISHRSSLSVKDDAEPGWKLLQAALEEVARYLKRDFAFGNDQRAMLELLDSDLALHAAEWEALHRTLDAMSPLVANDVTTVLNIMGDHVAGDKFENISSSTIVNRSTVQDAFNSLNEASMEDVRAELEEMLRKVEESGSSEASEVAVAFVEESGGARRRAVLRGLWDRLKELAPVVGGLATAGTAIGKSLLGVP